MAGPTQVLDDLSYGHYETVAASQSTQVLGAAGAQGDYLSHLLVIPAALTTGDVQIKDGSDTAITVFDGDTDGLASRVPFTIPLGLKSRTGAWQITTGASLSVVAVGRFS